MARMSRAVRETIQTVAVVLIIIVAIIVFVIYPLNRAKALMARPDIDTYSAKPLATNDASAFAAAGVPVDTFRVEADGLTNLACVRLEPKRDSTGKPKGLVILVHQDGLDRSSLAEPARQLADSGFEVLAFDQRASGLTTEKYRSDGQLEAADLEGLIAYLEIQGKLRHPLIVAGYGLGADAALLAENDEQRIDRVVAIEPYLSSESLIRILCQRRGVMWFPFSQKILWWWYKIRSGYALEYRTPDHIAAVHCPTLLAVPSGRMNDPEVRKLTELSPGELLTVKSVQDVDLVKELTTALSR